MFILLSIAGLLIKPSFAVFPPYFPVLNQNVHRNYLIGGSLKYGSLEGTFDMRLTSQMKQFLGKKCE